MRDSLFLVDSSVWLETLPPGREGSILRERVSALLAEDRVATTGMILLEILGGARSDVDYHRLRRMMSPLHRIPVREEFWEIAGRLGFDMRRGGLTVPCTDLLIATVAIQSGAVLLHRDRHFDAVASRSQLQVESHV